MRHDIDWRPVIDEVVWIPPPYRDAVVPEATAMRMLRCTPESFTRLVELGLPVTDGHVDVCDVRNAALYAKSGVTDVEVAMSTVFRYMRARRDELVAERVWDYTIDVTPASGTMYRPTPEDCGGRLDAGGHDGDRIPVPRDGRIAGRLVTRGVEREVRSPAIRRIARDLLGSGVRFHAVPAALDLATDDALALGIGGCVSLSVALARELVAAGFDAEARLGWLAGALETTHAWVEVHDDDGGTAWLDPALAVLATTNGLGDADFGEFVLGSAINRLVPTHCPASVGLGYGTPPGCAVRFACREVAS